MIKTKNVLVALAFILAAGTVVGFAAGGPKKTKAAGIGWYDSFDLAQIEAKATKKPILFLSMFGKLDEKMPCANARTLRATLFQDPEFKKLVTQDVIPAWEMVRAVPHVEIDLGDGKKITRTVRGNAVMYLCTPDGKVLDAYPGVYTSEDFMPMVRESLAKLANSDTNEVIAYHKEGGRMVRPLQMTFGKMFVESPTLDFIGAKKINGSVAPIAKNINPAERNFLLSAQGLRDMSLTPMTTNEAILAVTGKPKGEINPNEMAKSILESDSHNNVKNVRAVVHMYFASLEKLPTPLEARDAILETILKIPYKDPYFGLKDVLLPGTPD